MYCIDCGTAFFPDTHRERCIDCQIIWLASQQTATADEPAEFRIVHGEYVDGDGRPPMDDDERLAAGFAAMEGVV